MTNQFFKLITMLCLFILTSCGAALEPPKSNIDYKNIIGKPIKISNIEVAQYDFPEEMNWEDAKIFCTNLGKGWRLPTIEELNYLYQNRVAIGGFTGKVYWSSTEEAYSTSRGTSFSENEFSQASITWNPYSVRAVRALEQSAALEPPKNNIDYEKNQGPSPKRTIPISNYDSVNIIIGTPIKIGNLEVAEYAFPKMMNWAEAKRACAALGEGWRLPNKEELNILYQNKENIRGFVDGYYWSSTVLIKNFAWSQRFNNGKQDWLPERLPAYVRAIRTF